MMNTHGSSFPFLFYRLAADFFYFVTTIDVKGIFCTMNEFLVLAGGSQMTISAELSSFIAELDASADEFNKSRLREAAAKTFSPNGGDNIEMPRLWGE